MERVAVYPGSFDPPTWGHLDVIERASQLFDRLVVAVGINNSKVPMLSVDERIESLDASTKHLPNVQIDSFQGLLVNYVHGLGASAVVRGLRATSDFEYEFQMAMVNRRLDENIETIVFLTRWEFSYLSSSIVREVAVLGGDFSGMVPPPVAETMARALSRKGPSAGDVI